MIIEACIENYIEGIKAVTLGAQRLELCENLSVGGTTPSYGSIKLCVEKLSIPTLVMIRPRGGTFVYSDDEIQLMLEEIKICNTLKPHGVVFGCLTSNNQINYPLMEKLINACNKDIQIVCHRAFDEVKDSYKEVEHLAQIGVNKILTSGGAKTFFEGVDNLIKISQECNKHNVSLTGAGKIDTSNLEDAIKAVKADALHGRLIVGKLD